LSREEVEGMAQDILVAAPPSPAARAAPPARPAGGAEQPAGLLRQLYRRGRRWLRHLSGIRMHLLRQYPPRPLYLPAHYLRIPLRAPAITFSIVTPSRNQGAFLERTVHSVLGQGYPHLEYIVQDGGSTDGSKEILQRHGDRFKNWASEPDGGQTQAINRGFRHATGEVLAYLNSDDLLLPGTLHYVADFLDRHPEVDVVYGHRVVIDEDDNEIGRWVLPRHDAEVLAWSDFVPQETLFWRRGIWERVGAALDESFQFAMDWDLLLRFRAAGATFARLPRFLGAFRVHPAQKTTAQLDEVGVPEMDRLIRRCHGRLVPPRERQRRVFGYLCRHGLYYQAYRLGLLRY
jgi:glycosyltransferase involved in cell wall biosynthesis